MGLENIPNLIWDVHVLDKGRKLIEDFESQRTFAGIWGTYHLRIFDWLMGIIAGVVSAYLIQHYVLK
jgi:hypothetical protein